MARAAASYAADEGHVLPTPPQPPQLLFEGSKAAFPRDLFLPPPHASQAAARHGPNPDAQPENLMMARSISTPVCSNAKEDADPYGCVEGVINTLDMEEGLESTDKEEGLRARPFRIRVFQENLGCIQIYPDISVGIFSPSNKREKRRTLLESSPHAQALRGKTDEHKMLLRAGCRCLQNGALSE